jgi:hypothetical protein
MKFCKRTLSTTAFLVLSPMSLHSGGHVAVTNQEFSELSISCLTQLEHIIERLPTYEDQSATQDEFLRSLVDLARSAAVSAESMMSLTHDLPRYLALQQMLKPYNGAGKSVLYGVLSRFILAIQSSDPAALVRLSTLIDMCL